MPKQLINVIGIVVCLGVVILAVVLVAMPMFFQSLTTAGESVQVERTNDLYQAQVDTLDAESERMDEIAASVDALRAEIPAANRLDDVFELVAASAARSDVSVQTITAGEDAGFTVRTEPLALADAAAEQPAAEQPDASETTADAAATDGSATPTPAPAAGEGAVPAPPRQDTGRRQVDFTLDLVATDLNNVVRFLDALREGPRLLSPIETTVTPTGTGYDVSITALTFVLPEG
ncbi:hypothetical protein HF576_18955 [Microbacterium sp. CFH 90308]|uniref:Tfp pilus assembly protein PilO n=1 Tax=Microbacterium salsuginis TaxID=2722803 RepID=A0ABX1KHN1_9MICO|nr:hypothetical protein [Microbacterium sp. CFH 90308]NLP85915.1 hypothetical protein [Microbacterium sp. CFH 90308]